MNLPIYEKLILTAVLILIVFLVRLGISRVVSRRERLEIHHKRRILVTVRDILSVLLFISFVILWYPQLKTVATTVTVIAVAIVIATKEYILNITGFLHRSSVRMLGIGDRIEFGEFRGDVVDTTLLGITLLEIGPGTNQYTGKTIYIPNSVFLNNTVKNETRMRQYVFHIIQFPLAKEDNWETSEKILLEIAEEIVAPYIDEVRQYMKKITRRHSLEVPAVEPRIYIQMPEPEQLNLVLRMPVPIQRRGRVEQQVIREYLSRKADR